MLGEPSGEGVAVAVAILVKAALANGPAVTPKAGDKVNYTLTVNNTGPTPLSNVSIADPLLASAASPAAQQVALLDLANAADSADFATAAFDLAGTRSGIVASANRSAHLKLAGDVVAGSALYVSRHLVRMSGANGDLQPGEKIGVLYNLVNYGDHIVYDIAVTQPDSVSFGGRVSQLAVGDSDGGSMIFTREITAQEIAAGPFNLTLISPSTKWAMTAYRQ